MPGEGFFTSDVAGSFRSPELQAVDVRFQPAKEPSFFGKILSGAGGGLAKAAGGVTGLLKAGVGGAKEVAVASVNQAPSFLDAYLKGQAAKASEKNPGLGGIVVLPQAQSGVPATPSTIFAPQTPVVAPPASGTAGISQPAGGLNPMILVVAAGVALFLFARKKG